MTVRLAAPPVIVFVPLSMPLPLMANECWHLPYGQDETGFSGPTSGTSPRRAFDDRASEPSGVPFPRRRDVARAGLTRGHPAAFPLLGASVVP